MHSTLKQQNMRNDPHVGNYLVLIYVLCHDVKYCHALINQHLTSFPALPSAPTITSLISTNADQLTVTWTSVPTATSYNIRIKGPVFGTGYSVLSIGAPQYMYSFTGLTNKTVYTVSVEAVSCAGSSSPVIGIIKSHVHYNLIVG